jgi:hypothetical protein
MGLGKWSRPLFDWSLDPLIPMVLSDSRKRLFLLQRQASKAHWNLHWEWKRNAMFHEEITWCYDALNFMKSPPISSLHASPVLLSCIPWSCDASIINIILTIPLTHLPVLHYGTNLFSWVVVSLIRSISSSFQISIHWRARKSLVTSMEAFHDITQTLTVLSAQFLAVKYCLDECIQQF